MKIAMDIENIQRSNSFSHWGLTYHRSQAAQAPTMKPTQPTMKLALFMRPLLISLLEILVVLFVYSCGFSIVVVCQVI